MKYDKYKGFGISKINYKQGDDRKVKWFTLVCSHEGISKNKVTHAL